MLFSQHQLSIKEIDSSLALQKNSISDNNHPKISELTDLLDQSQKKNYKVGESLSLLLISNFYISNKDDKKAEEYLNQYDVLEKDNKNFQSAEYYFIKGKLEAIRQNNDEALPYFIKAESLADKKDIRFLSVLYSGIAKIYGKNKDFNQQILYLEKVNKTNDNIRDYDRMQFDKTGIKSDKKSNNISVIFIFITLLVIGIIVTVWLWYFGRKQNKSVPENVAFYLSNRAQEEIGFITPELIQQAWENDNSFYSNFLKAFPDFSNSLLSIDPTLKSSDIEFCALIRLNFETKQIAVIKNMSVRAVEGKKYRIRKRLDIRTEDNMYIWMSKL